AFTFAPSSRSSSTSSPVSMRSGYEPHWSMSISSPWYQSSRSTLNTFRVAFAITPGRSYARAGALARSVCARRPGCWAGIAVVPSPSRRIPCLMPRPPRSPGAPVLQHVAQRVLERDRGLPAGRGHELRVVSEQDLHVGRTQAGRILLHLDLRLRLGEQHVERLADGPAAAAADVVDLARITLLQGQHVAPHHVPDVGEIALRVEVADAQHRRRAPPPHVR